MKRLGIRHKGGACVLGPLLLQLVLFGLLYTFTTKTEQLAKFERTRSEIVSDINSIISTSTDVYGNIATTIFNPDKRFETDLPLYKRKMEVLHVKLKKQTKDDPELSKIVSELVGIFHEQYAILENISTNTPGSVGIPALMKMQPILRQTSKRFSRIKARMDVEASKIAQLRKEENESRSQLKTVIISGIFIDIVLAVILLAWFLKHITDRLELLVTNARLIPQGKELDSHVNGTDEIAYLDEILHQASQELHRAAEYRKSLMEMVAHDLRSPLMASNLSLDLMLTENQDGPAKLKQRIGSLKSSLSRLVGLVEDLLSIDKLESGQAELNLEVINIKEVVEESIESIEAQAVQKHVDIRNELISITIVADHNRMLQVAGNFLSNAIKFSPKNGTIIVSSKQDSSHLVVSITDQGPGIKTEEQASLFEKFYQAEEGKAQKGFGLGLAICKMIVTQHGGTIGVSSEPGKGSTFWFSLPLDEDANADR